MANIKGPASRLTQGGTARVHARTLVLLLCLGMAGALRQKGSETSAHDDWQACASEGTPIPGAGRVRFGWGMVWTEAQLPAGAACSIASFGNDPTPGILKMCQCAADNAADASTSHRTDLGINWSFCGHEGDKCSCPTGTIRFGVGSRWSSAQFESSQPSVSCEVANFRGEDPATGYAKECWCADRQESTPPPARVAIVLLSRHPPDLHRWLAYHVNYMGVEHVFMLIEDTPEFTKTWQSLPSALQSHVTVWKGSPPQPNGDQRPTDDYETLQARQVRTMASAKEAAANMGISWLIHIDDDELLYAPVRRSVGSILASMPAGFDQAYIPNVEAVYPSPDIKSCFSETRSLNMNPPTFVSYANGKAAVRASSHDAVPAGPHMWKKSSSEDLPSIHLTKEPFGSPLMVVHFESCPFSRWEDKYWELGNTSPQKIRKIPFRFYKESIRRMQRCRGSGQNPADCSQAAMRHLWARWKTAENPAIRPSDLMPLHIPWEKITV